MTESLAFGMFLQLFRCVMVCAITLPGVQDDEQSKGMAERVNQLLSRDPREAISQAKAYLENEELEAEERAKLKHYMARGLTMMQDFPAAIQELEQAETIAREIDDRRLLTRILQAKSVACCENGDYRSGAEAAREGIEIANATRDELLYGILHSELGTNLFGLSEYENAIAAFTRALDVARKMENRKLQAIALGNLASIHDEMENFERATELHRDTLRIFLDAKNDYLAATTQVNLANSLLAQEEFDEAQQIFDDTVKLTDELGFHSVKALAHVGRGDIALYQENVESAQAEYEIARECWKKIGDQSGPLMLVERNARIEKINNAEAGLSQKAVQELQSGLDQALEQGNTKQAISIAEHLLLEYVDHERWEQATRIAGVISELKEKVWSNENQKLIDQAETRVKLLEKEKQIQELNHTNQIQRMEIKTQNNMRAVLIASLCLAGLVIILTGCLLVGRRRAYQRLQHEHAERRRQEQRQIELERKLADQDKSESLRIMAGGIAHDFNNLMTGIVGQAEVGKFQSEVSEKDENFEQIIDVAKQASGLTSQLVNFVGRSASLNHAFDVVPLVSGGLKLMNAVAKPKADVELRCEEKQLAVLGDETQIRQVLINLVKNAAESIEKSGKVTLTVSHCSLDAEQLSRMPHGEECRPGDFCRLQVADDGCGIKPGMMRKIFDPFFTTKSVGRGLGLASVLGIVRSHHGTIEVESKLGAGTTVSVFLPLGDLDSLKSSRAGRLGRSRMVAGETEVGVLFVDDDKLVRQSAANILVSFGFKVFSAGSAEEAIEVAKEYRSEIRVAVIDYTMTGRDGVWLAKRFREMAPKIALILCSGYKQEAIRESGLFAAFLPKPFVAIDLVDLIQQTIEERPKDSLAI